MKLTLSEQQQQEMRHAYYDGAPGILVSGLVWSSAATWCFQTPPSPQAELTLQ